jgi:hypothetical protein
LETDVPTVESFFNLTNELAPGRKGSLGRPQLPDIVRDHLDGIYKTNYGTKDPIATFAEVSGINDLANLLANPPSSVQWPDQVYDTNAYLPTNVTEPQFSAYDTVCKKINGYYLSTLAEQTNNKAAVELFFNEFATDIIVNLRQADPGSTGYNDNLTKLTAGFRALMAMTYDASPFWASYGIGFSNGANPLILNDLATQKTTPIETYSGQEFQVRNIQLPANFLNVTTYNPFPTTSAPSFPQQTWPTDGWDALLPATTLYGTNYITTTAGISDSTLVVPDNSYQWYGEITSSDTSVIFQGDSYSSDTVDARFIASTGALTKDSPTGIDNKSFSELNGEINSFLPDTFTTYISTAGGVDLVHGSQFADVIVGPSRAATHGRLTVSAGDGADLVAPGRGGSLVELGSGSDTVFFSGNDIFGETTFLDFTRDSQDQDKVILGSGLDVKIDSETPWEATITDSATKATKVLRLVGNSVNRWEYIFFESVTFSGENDIPQTPNGEFNYLETHSFMDPGAKVLKDHFLIIGTLTHPQVIDSTDSMSINQLRVGDILSVSIGGQQETYTATLIGNPQGQAKIGVRVDLNKFPDAVKDGRALAISVTPLRLPVDPSFQVFTGTVINQGYSHADLINGPDTVTFDVSGVDVGSSYPFVRDYMQLADGSQRHGSSMYLFDNTGGSLSGGLIGKVSTTVLNNDGTGTIDVFIDKTDLGAGAQLSIGTNLGWKFADAPSYGGQQFEIFINRMGGYIHEYRNVTTEEFKIKASVINAAIPGGPLSNSYNLATNSATKNSHLPFSKWVALPYTSGPTRQFAYMGGLAKFIYENNLHYSSDRTSFPSISIVLDEDDLLVASGSGKVNLSSNFSVFEVDSNLNGVTPEQFVDNLNTVQADVSGGQYAIPTGMPDASEFSFKGTYSLATKSRIFVTGAGRINGWNVYSDPTYVAGALNRSPKSSHPDWQSNIYYTIGSDILTASSSASPAAGTHAIAANSFTAAWPSIKGIGGVRFQEFDSLGLIGQNGLSVVDKNALTPENPLRFKSSPVFLREFKQLGGWIWQADGPQIAGWNSTITQSFIHANDDSLKFGAPGLNADQITILQGKAGVAVGTSYGYLNGGFDRGVADGIYAHRVVTDNETDTSLVSVWASPVADYFWDTTTNETPQGLIVQNVFVPKLDLNIAQVDTTDPTQPGGNLEWDLNSINRAANVDFGQKIRGFPMLTTEDIPLELELGDISLYSNWDIGTNVKIPNTVRIHKNIIPGGNIVKTGHGDYQPYTNVHGGWTQLPKPTNFTGPGYDNEQFADTYNVGIGPDVTISQTGNISLYAGTTTQVSRPQLKRASTIRLDRDSNVIGPQPVVLMHSHIEDAVNANSGSGENHSYIVTNVASGKVEKKVGTTWIDVNAPLKTSSPLAMIAWLKNRMISAGDEIRYVVETEDEGEVTARAFELIGWDGSSISEERTSVEIDASGWQDF